jgi:hypothetical protein
MQYCIISAAGKPSLCIKDQDENETTLITSEQKQNMSIAKASKCQPCSSGYMND